MNFRSKFVTALFLVGMVAGQGMASYPHRALKLDIPFLMDRMEREIKSIENADEDELKELEHYINQDIGIIEFLSQRSTLTIDTNSLKERLKNAVDKRKKQLEKPIEKPGNPYLMRAKKFYPEFFEQTIKRDLDNIVKIKDPQERLWLKEAIEQDLQILEGYLKAKEAAEKLRQQAREVFRKLPN